MSWAFHQNLQNFGGGGDSAKVELLMATLTRTRTQLTNPIVVGGFTEITNASTSLTQIPGLFSALQLNRYIITNVGTTAVANKDEYISIGWNVDLFAVSKVGLVRAVNGGGFRYEDKDYVGSGRYAFPDFAGQIADSRGLLYIAGQDRSKKNWVFGFMHNMYTVGDKTRFPMNIGTITAYIAGSYNATVILGGDFNVYPVGARNGYGHSCAASTTDGTAWWNTTLSNPYDWWYVGDTSYSSDKDARLGFAIEDDTHGRLALFPSDHRPILLQIK